MRKYLLACISTLLMCTIQAQNDPPDFGKIDKSDLLLKQCEFDPDAAAYKLIDIGDVRYDYDARGLKIVSERRIRIKILKDKGLDEANIKIPYISQDQLESIDNLTAVTYNLDDAGNVNVNKLEKSSIFKKPVNSVYSEVAFSFPDVKVGSVIEYKYDETNQDLTDLPDWYFQSELPTRFSEYRILIPSIFRFYSQSYVYQNVESSQKEEDQSFPVSDGVAHIVSNENTFILRNVPALRDEPFMGADKDYLQRLEFQLNQIVYPSGQVEDILSTWPKLTKELMDDNGFGKQLRKNLSNTGSLDDSLKLLKSDYDKMAFIYNYVQKNMNWNDDENIFSPEGIKSAWDKKSGNNTEINLILIDLLRNAGITSYPLLVSTRDHGIVNTLYPLVDQFNNTMVFTEVDGKRYILDASDKYNPVNLIPYDVLNNEAFVVDIDHGGWIKLTDDFHKYDNSVSLFATISADGVMSGEATITSTGYSKNPRVKKWTEDKSNYGDYFTKAFTGLKVDSIEMNDAVTDTMPMDQKIKFSMPVNSSGDYEYFPLNLFQGLEKNPFIDDRRSTDIEFGYQQSYRIIGKIYIPAGYGFEALPKNIKMIIPDTSIIFTRLMQTDDNSIDFMISENFLKPEYSVDEYPMVKEFYKKLFDALNEQVVIRKKKS
jgi:Domain of Unknown Function with PDB structure (DUF3857)/Transglutaminase-like superfamily